MRNFILLYANAKIVDVAKIVCTLCVNVCYFVVLGDPYSRHCDIEDNLTSVYVSALFERYTIVSGCSSIEVTNTTTPPREVHVINLVNSAHSPDTVAPLSGNRVVVRLDIKPIGDTGMGRSVVTIYYSDQKMLQILHI